MIRRLNRMKSALRLAAGLVLALGLSVSHPVLAASAASKAGKNGKSGAAVSASKSPEKAASVAKGRAKDQKLANSTRRTGKAQTASLKSRKTVAVVKGKRSTQVARAPRKGGQVAAKKGSAGKTVLAHSVVRVPVEPRLSTGERLGLRAAHDPLELSSSVALVVDQNTSEVLFSKNDTAVLPIASLTKLMTGLVIADANLSLDEQITITEEDAAVYRNSRLAVGSTLSRGELMHLALMSSENRAANALGRTFPGGPDQFVRRMNAKARELGMHDTRYVEPTGLSSSNQSSARDLATLVSVAYERPILRSLSTSPSHELDLGRRTLHYNNSNRLIRNPEWEIGLQKTGYISEAGRCLVMQAKVAGRQLIMVFLDSAGKLSRAQDAERVRRWVEAQTIQQQFARPQG
jgi:D-alanyl-D-alanine endopeptidase (penicillin-binding protein 7)